MRQDSIILFDFTMTNGISCPLCGNNKYLVRRHWEINKLSSLWLVSFGFDPFLDKGLGGTLSKIQCTDCQLLYFDPVFLGDGAFYEKLAKNAWYYEEEKWEFTEALQIILERKPQSLLEIGCGNGNFLRKVKYAIEKVEGLEINEEAIRFCRENNLNVSSRPMSGVTDSFDMVVMFEVLEHLDKPKETVEQLIQLTKKGGLLIIAVPNPDGYLKEIDTVLLDMPPHHSGGWTLNTFDFIAKKYNLEKVHYALEPLRDVHYQSFLSSKPKSAGNTSEHIKLGKTIKSRFLGKAKRFISEALQPSVQPVLDKIDHLAFRLEKNSIIGQTHLIAFRKN
jgi:SAM-dependent methyltransferase